MNTRARLRAGRRLVIALPYTWLLLFFLIPFLIVFKISLSQAALAIPPYSQVISYANEQLNIVLSFSNYLFLLSDSLYLQSYLQSLKVAAISTLLCLLIGFPLAWAIVHSRPSTRNVLLMLVILPSWTSFLIRVYAWMGIL